MKSPPTRGGSVALAYHSTLFTKNATSDSTATASPSAVSTQLISCMWPPAFAAISHGPCRAGTKSREKCFAAISHGPCRAGTKSREKCCRYCTVAARIGPEAWICRIAQEAITADVAAGVTVLRGRARLTASRYSSITTLVRECGHGSRAASPRGGAHAVQGGGGRRRAEGARVRLSE